MVSAFSDVLSESRSIFFTTPLIVFFVATFLSPSLVLFLMVLLSKFMVCLKIGPRSFSCVLFVRLETFFSSKREGA